MVLGAAFLGIKSVEYYHKFVEHHVPGPGFQFEAGIRPARAAVLLAVLLMTGLHALHMIIGIGIMLWMLWWTWRGTITAGVLQPDRNQRALLALRRHRLDLPVPASLSARPPCALTITPPEGPIRSSTFVPKRVYYAIFAVLMLCTS